MDLKQNFSKQLTKINMKTSSFLEINKIRTYISTLESEMEDLKKKAGEVGYVMWREDQWNQESLNEIYQEIENRGQTIREQEKEIRELEEKNRQVLGTAAQPEAGKTGEGSFSCPGCGAKYTSPAKFCRKCGCKMIQE